ncbi:MAG: molybdopterin synthase sulfur carrier subunit [Nitrosomonas sp.]|nr:MAG: molybdopterin synthase sulfur carrier subunit [Nitrosomonas sp.]
MTILHITYFAALRDATGYSEETLTTEAVTAKTLFYELTEKYHWRFTETDIRIAINDRYRPPDTPLKEGDRVVFIPPVAGG